MFRTRHTRRGTGRPPSIARWLGVAALLALAAQLLVPVGIASAQITLLFTTTLGPASQAGVIGIESTVTATVTLQGNPVPNAQVLFTVTGQNPRTATITTNESGQASLSYAGTTAGTDSITAQVGPDVVGPVTITWASTAASGISVNPTTRTSLTGATNEFTATVTDSQGAGVSGIQVRYSVSGANSVGVTAGGVTDGSGNATFSYTGLNAGTDTITIFADLNNNGSFQPGEPQTTATVTLTAPSGFSIAPTTQTALVGTSASVVAHVTAAGNAPLAGAVVHYTISGVGAREGEATTDDNGNATIDVTGNQAGVTSIAASVIGASGPVSATIRWVTGPINLAVSAADADISSGQNASVSATVTDGSGNPIPNVSVRFSSAGANTPSGTHATNQDGVATFSYLAARAGSDTVTAHVDLNSNGAVDQGEPTGTAVITIAASPSSLTLVPPSQSVQVGTSALVSATVTNATGSAASVPVRYTVSGANTASGTATTDSNGNTSISYTGQNAGNDSVSAYADFNGNNTKDAAEPSATATVTWGTGSGPVPGGGLPAAQRTTAKAGCMYFPQTGHNICAGFLQYWNQFGGLAVYGMPLTEEFVENGMTVQYFERQRFEWHPGEWPERFDVMLGLLGNDVTATRRSEAPFRSTTAKNDPSCVFYAQTGHNLCAGFKAYWERYGGLAVYGFPISEEFQERNPDTGQIYTVQYFERARFEWHPGEWPERYDVMLGRLGAQVLQSRYGVQP